MERKDTVTSPRQEPSAATVWTREEMRNAVPYPLPEVPEPAAEKPHSAVPAPPPGDDRRRG